MTFRSKLGSQAKRFAFLQTGRRNDIGFRIVMRLAVPESLAPKTDT